MHDIDRALFEAEAQTYGETYESEGQMFGEDEYPPPGADGLGQSREHALAADLLEVTNEADLDHFLGKVLKSAVSAVRDFARSDTGRAVGGVLKSAAAQALPQLGQLAGDALRPAGASGTTGAGDGRADATGQGAGRTGRGAGTTGGRAGAAGKRAAGKQEVGLQTEGLSAEDHEYQTARAFVRFADETAHLAAEMAGSAPPAVVAQQAATAAAQRHLPGLLRAAGATGLAASATGAIEGRWIRRGDRIVVLGA